MEPLVILFKFLRRISINEPVTTTVFFLVVLAFAGWMILRRKSTSEEDINAFKPKETPENLTEPILSYSLYVIDTRLNRRMELQSHADFPHQYGIIQGQTAELHWNVLNADWISIEGDGFVQAIGKKELFPQQHTTYKLIAKNRNYSKEISFLIRVFPVPVMEKLKIPIPEINTHTIELFKTTLSVIKKPDSIPFPSFRVPGVIELQRNHSIPQPVPEALNTHLISRTIGAKGFTTFKSGLLDKLEDTFKDYPEIKNIVQSIRKYYKK